MGELHVESVPAFLHTEIQGEQLPEVPPNFPFTRAFLDRFVDFCPVVVEIGETEKGQPGITSKLLDTTNVVLRQTSPQHGRSYEILLGEMEPSVPAMAFWQDEHGNGFSSLSLKGNNFSKADIFTSSTAPSGYIPHGLQETDSFLRVTRASRIMREQGVDTEMVVRVVEPKTFRINKHETETDVAIENQFEYVTLPEYKRRLLLTYWREIAETDNALEKFADVTKAINEMSFFVTLRAMSTDVRIADICEPTHFKDCRNQLGKVFEVYNQLYANTPNFEKLDINKDKDIKEYAGIVLPELIGKNLALLHRAGLYHNFPTYGNLNALGGIIDLDSVKGAPLGLGDAPATADNYHADLMYFLSQDGDHSDIRRLFEVFNMLSGYDHPLHTELHIKQFRPSFVESYMQHRFPAILEDDKLMDANELEQMVQTMNYLQLHTDMTPDLLLARELKMLCPNPKLPERPFMVMKAEEELTEFSTSLHQKLDELFINQQLEWLQKTPEEILEFGAVFAATAATAIIDEFYEYLNMQVTERVVRLRQLEDHNSEVETLADTFISPELKAEYATAARHLVDLFLTNHAMNHFYETFNKDNELRGLLRHIVDIYPTGLTEGAQEAQTVLFNGILPLVSKIELDTLWNSILGESKHTIDIAAKGPGEVVIESTYEMVLCDVMYDGSLNGPIQFVESTKEVDKFKGAGTIMLPVGPDNSFVGWLTVNKNEDHSGYYELHLRVNKETLPILMHDNTMVLNPFALPLGQKVLAAYYEQL